MANVLLGVTGSVAAVKTPLVLEALGRAGHEVTVVATQASLYFFDPAAVGRERLVLDEDEWPGRDEGRRWQRDDEVLHIRLRRRADLLLVAPLDANTLAKFALGLADNCLTCVWRAWEPARPVVLAPAMNTLMWQHPVTVRHLRRVCRDLGERPPRGLAPDALVEWVNERGGRLRFAAPESRRLACGDVGVGAMAAPETIAAAVRAALDSPPSHEYI